MVSGSYFAVVIKTDGTLWTWGYNNNGQLGLGNYQSYSSPKQIGSLTNWLRISCGRYHTVALKTDGTLWSWGQNTFGQIGVSSAAYYFSSPNQVGSLTTWSSISTGAGSSYGIHS